MGCHTLENAGTEAELIRMSPLAQECAMCHVDPHLGQFLRTELGEETVLCKRCHIPDQWTNLQFDHNRDSRFKLDGAHEKVNCNLCHKSVAVGDSSSYIVYRPLGLSCADCHASDADIRKGD
jgi:Zn finger protein HypA/HybF involved in hydrogenase expression